MALRAMLYTASGKDREVDLRDGMRDTLEKDQLLWVDLDAPDDDALARVGKALALPERAIASISAGGSRAELERFPELIRLRVAAAQPIDDGDGATGGDERDVPLETAVIDVMAAPNTVVTVHDGSIAAFDGFVKSIHGDTRLGALDAAGFMTALIDSVLGVYLSVVEGVERRIDKLDELAVRSNDAERFLAEIIALRRRVAALRRALAPLRVALAPLARPDLEIPGLGETWPGLMDRVERTIDAVANMRELLIGSFDLFMATNADRTNDIMKTLTILNAVLLPAAVVAGVMGMNFALGFFDQAANFWLVIGAMLLLATGILGFSRWRGWI
jgi:magnesium transporter